MRSMVIGTVALVLAGTVGASARVSNEQTDGIRESAAVLNEIHGEPAKDVPQDLWDKARCVIVIPSLKKAAFVVGGEYGKGLVSCRRDAVWTAPVFMKLEKGSWGFQIGAESLFLSLPVFAQPPQSGAINPGKRIDDKHNPRDGFIVVDEDTRLGYIKNATIWRPFDLTGADLSEGQSLGANKDGLPRTLLNDKVVVCDFKLQELGGTTPKFDCDHIKLYNTVEDAANKQHEIPHALKKAKVRYGRSSEQDVKPYSTIIATRIAWALGFFADIETPVQEVICNGCTQDPFHQKAPAAGKSFTFTTASIEQHLDITGIIGIDGKGKDLPYRHAKGPEAAWYWTEGQDNITDPARRAQFEALELLAAFLKDGDTKAVQNRLGCLPGGFDEETGICNAPVMMVHDFGNTLGSDGLSVHPLNFDAWSKAKIWDDPKTCKTSIRNNIGNGSGLDHPIIHQAGLKLLADSLHRLIADDENVLAIFSAAKIEQYDDHGTKHTAREWADLFKKRAQSIIDSRCEP